MPHDQLNKDKLYYLCHPCDTFGDPEENRADALRIEKLLESHGYIVLNPIRIIPQDLPYGQKMKRCKYLVKSSDVLIHCANWTKSKGCRKEDTLARQWQLAIVEFTDFELEPGKP